VVEAIDDDDLDGVVACIGEGYRHQESGVVLPRSPTITGGSERSILHAPHGLARRVLQVVLERLEEAGRIVRGEYRDPISASLARACERPTASRRHSGCDSQNPRRATRVLNM
jgi:hypothetical protein